MIWIDVAILAVIALSAIVGFFRGFLREALGLATWIVAFWMAFMFANSASEYLRRWIDADSARLAVAFAVVFIGVLIVGAVFNYLLGRLISQTGFAGTDRALGIVFGVVRGVAVLVLLVLLAGVTPVPKDNWWQQSLFVGQLEAGAIWVRDYLPPNIAQAINYPGTPGARSVANSATT
jgi:membrane protein required for colicin V production